MVRLALSILLTPLLSMGCSSEPKVVTVVQRVYPAGPPPGACEPQPTPDVAGMMDYKERGLVYAAAAALAQAQLRRCDIWIKGWKAEAAKP